MATISTSISSNVYRLQALLHKIDRLRLPIASRRDVETILVRQVTRELDRLLPHQQGHGRRTAAMAMKMGTTIGLTAEELHHLKLGAYLHDIGQLALRPTCTTGRHSRDAYVSLQNHPRLGAQILEPFTFLQNAAVLIAHHHERWDGSGYPYGIRGPFIPLGARILAIADAFDAIDVPKTTSRLLRDQVAYRILRVAAGTQFDPYLIDRCRGCFTYNDGKESATKPFHCPSPLSHYADEEMP